MFNMERFASKKAEQAEIMISQIITNPDQPRKIFEEKELMELRDSIIELGIIQPLIVKRQDKNRYSLIAGERRLRAAELAGLDRVPAVIRDVDEKDTALIALVENVQRENLNYMEEALAYKRLMEEYELTQGEIAKKVGKQQSTISNKIRLLGLPDEIQFILAENQLSERHARALLRVTDDILRRRIIDKIVENGLNVKQSEKLIDDLLEKHEEERRKKDKIRFINYRIYINTIKKAFSCINDADANATYKQEDKGDHLEVVIIIPKNETLSKQVGV